MSSEIASFDDLVRTAQQAEVDQQLERAANAWAAVRRTFPQQPIGYTSGGWVLRRLGRFSEAESVLDEGLSRFPGDEWIPIGRAWIAHDQGDLHKAGEIFRAVRAKYPRNAQGYLGEAAISRRAGAYPEAEEIYRAALELFPADPTVWVELAWTAEEQRDIAEALRRWEIVRTRFPHLPQGYVRAGELLRDSQRWSEAELLLEDACKRFPKDPHASIAYAWVAHHRRDWPEALKRWERVIAGFQHLPQGRSGAAQSLMEMGRFNEATQVLVPARRMFPHDQVILRLSGWLATRRREMAEAEKLWAELRERFPNDLDGYFGFAIALREVGRLDEADEMLRLASVKFPSNETVAMDFAEIAVRKRNWPLAVQRWRDILQRFPHVPRAYVGLGESLHHAGDPVEGAAAFRAGRERFPEDIPLAAAEAGIAARASDWPRAVQMWTQLVERFPDDAAPRLGLGRTLRDSGDLVRSEDRLREALRRFPDHVELMVQLALTLSWKRQWPEALSLWKFLKEGWPANAEVIWGISQILPLAQRDQQASRPEPFEIPPILSASDAEPSEHIQAMASLFKRFESLGADCEFGMVQGIFRVDQPSLLRWATTSPDDLVKALQARFDGVGDPEHTIIRAAADEYTSEDRRYFMHSHTFTPPSTQPIEEFALEHGERLQWLRRKLVEDLSAAKRIFVYKYNDGITDTQMMALYAAMQDYNAEIMLLCVRRQTPDHPSGTLQHVQRGLFAGYIDRFSTVDISVGIWTSLCQQVIAQLAHASDSEKLAQA